MTFPRFSTVVGLLIATSIGAPLVGCSAKSDGAAPDGGAGRGGSGGIGGATPQGSGGSGGAGGAGGGNPSDAAGGGGGPDSGGTVDPGASDTAPDIGAGDRPVTDGGNVDRGGPLPATRGPAGGACTGEPFGNPLPQNRTAALIRGNFGNSLLEAPVWVAAQSVLFFSEINNGNDVANGRIHKYTPASNSFVVFVDNVGVGGLAVDVQGLLVAASHDKQRLSRFDPASGQRTDVAGGAMYMGNPFNQVNDVVVRADGNMYFSDPTFKLAGRPGQGVMGFYRLSPAGVVTRITTAMNANGVALSPDGTSLYLSTTGGPAMQRFTLADDGSASAGATFLGNRSDGIAVDCAGNLYLSDGEIRVFSPTGQSIGNIGGLTSGFVTNSAFGGEDRKTLYITTSTALYQIRLNVPGYPN